MMMNRGQIRTDRRSGEIDVVYRHVPVLPGTIVGVGTALNTNDPR